MNPARSAFLEAATSVARLLAEPAVAAAWERPSALAKLSVSGLAGHLLNQIVVPGELLRSGAHPAALDPLRARLAGEPADRIVHLPWRSWSLTLDDLLLTRIIELAVHSDDLAVSVDIATPALPAHVTDPVLQTLVLVAARRHGTVALLRALSRAERAPATVTAF